MFLRLSERKIIQPTAYSSLYRGLKYLLKKAHFVQDYSNIAEFLIFETFCLGRAISEKKMPQ